MFFCIAAVCNIFNKIIGVKCWKDFTLFSTHACLQEDIEKIVSQLEEQDRKRQQIVEEKCGPPSPR